MPMLRFRAKSTIEESNRTEHNWQFQHGTVIVLLQFLKDAHER